MPKKIIVHLHVPKNAGNTFNYVLRSNFGNSIHEHYGLMDIHRFKSSEFQLMIKDHPQFSAYAMHMLSLDLPFEDPELDLKVITFVRPPTEWLFSFYNFQKNNIQNRLKGIDVFSDFIEKHIKLKSRRYINGQVNFLMRGKENTDPLAYFKELSESGHLILLPTDKFDLAMLALQEYMAQELPDCSYPFRTNVSKKEGESSKTTIDIDSVCNLDTELYQMAVDNLNTILDKKYPTSKELAKALHHFKRSCKHRRKKEKLHRNIKKFLKRFT